MIRKIVNIIGIAALMVSCSDALLDENPNNPLFLNGKEKTPIIVQTNVFADEPLLTRAVDGKWETNDKLFAYVQHVKKTSDSPLTYSEVSVPGTQPRIQYFKVSANINSVDNYTNNNLTPVNESGTATVGFYWDDFSVGAKGDETDIRTADHGLRALYGYCYNGGVPSTPLAESEGTLGWTVKQDQSTKTNEVSNFKLSDLLFSPTTPTPVAYDHGENNTIIGRTPVLSIPFTHAMSKVTVVVKLEDGFKDATTNFNNTSVILQDMNTVATVTAPTASVEPVAGDGNVKNVTTQPISTDAANKQKSFSALIAPTVMKAGNTLAKIVNVDGNDYEIKLSDAVLTNATSPANAWKTKLAAYDATKVTPDAASGYTAANGGLTLPGVHYKITVTIKKQQIKVDATITDWKDVLAEGKGEIQFTNDIEDKGSIQSELEEKGFTIYQSASGSSDYGSKYVTKYTYDGSADPKWSNSPAIYWPNGSDRLYFRALSNAQDDNESTLDVREDLTMLNGRDVLWGTTAAYTWGTGADKDVDEGAPVHPRTGDVIMQFYHAMAKVTFNLEDARKDDDLQYLHDGTCLNPLLDLEEATVQITGLANAGTINLHTGKITRTEPVTTTTTFPEGGTTRKGYYPAKLNGTNNTLTEYLAKDYPVIPQDLGEAQIIITLKNGTTYKAQLNKCKAGCTLGDKHTENKAIINWYPGVHYTYTITIAKEEITLKALVKKWDEETASGTADLEW